MAGPDARGRRKQASFRSEPVRLTHRIQALVGGSRAATPPQAVSPAPSAPAAPETGPEEAAAPAPPEPGHDGTATPPGGPGTATAAALGADPCGPSRLAMEDACSLADRMNALALAAQERLHDARRVYDEHAGRRERGAATADPRAVRAAKDEAQAAFRRGRLAARERAALEGAAAEWLREIDRINSRTREALRIIAREDAAERSLLQAVDQLGIEADGARIAAESAAEACRNARIALATCEEHERLGVAAVAPAAGGLAPASVVARATFAQPSSAERSPNAGTLATASEDYEGGAGGAARTGSAAVEPAIVPLLAGDRAVLRRLAATLAAGDPAAENEWEVHLAAFVAAVRARAIDGAALGFPADHPFWGPYTQQQCREISAALSALGYRFDGQGGFSDGRIPGQRDLSLAIGYAGLDPMRIRIWPTEAELPLLYTDVSVEAAQFVAGAAGELTLGEMIDMLGRRAEDLSDLWNAWGRVRPLLLGPA